MREAQRTGVPEAVEATAPKDAPAAGPAVAAVLGLQQSAGIQAVTRVLARAGFWDRLEAFFTGDYTAEVRAERVVVKLKTRPWLYRELRAIERATRTTASSSGSELLQRVA